MTNKKYDLIIFDWDGTIIDSEAHIIQTLQMAISDEGLSMPTVQNIRHIIGLSLSKAIEVLFPNLAKETIQRVADGYRTHFFKETTAASELFDGVADVIKDLHAHGYYLAVATGKGRHGLDMALQSSGLEPFFHITRCADETRSKPDPLMLDEILTDLDLESSKAIMVGDTSFDMDMANNIKMDSIAVTYGMHDKKHLENSNPTHFIDAINQLSQYV
ncbi:MAG: HAD-IA family hydrolase [Gammaproteobacteria bacterium]|jgi:phosphoglycolate phosphatase|nr:HAD-IA family hydrolase [Gammaproteobacteria bacterium]MBT3722185.1 HAD-IA family hydrolase [Gammaproteobacteria bacterium]MBT4078005.1 HAD-IA family hydrolase [Gammaproteobacteria bacterium]MBT4193502.1 HAD-IA family hydrolase [Gammaproteobacteria bacterium]MBT4452163.1 HAD-IA family hydrolase [Gammaproteobacteria bacterium]